VISCLTRIRPISWSSNTIMMIGSFSICAVCNSANRHQEAAVAGKGDHRPIGIGQASGERAGNRIAHRGETVGGGGIRADRRIPILHHQQPTGAGIAGGNRVRAAGLRAQLPWSRCGDRPVAGVLSASRTSLREGLCGFPRPNCHPPAHHFARPASSALKVADDFGIGRTSASCSAPRDNDSTGSV